MMKLFNFSERKAQKLHEQGQALSDEGKEQEAIDIYLKAIELDPGKSESFYNIGLIYKYLNQWEKSLEFNQKAYELDPDDEAARWNLAIAATALRKWDIARSAWKDNGIELDDGSGPIEDNFGITPVRLNPEGEAEVVWTSRIDPVRARIDSIPYAESGFKYGDIVLHDGAAVGYRKNGEREYAVFNVLELFEGSNYQTSIAKVTITEENDLDELENIFSTTPHEFEDWTTNIRNLCKQCSEGKLHEQHDHELKSEWNPERTLGVANNSLESVEALFKEWQENSNGKLLTLER